MPSGVRVRIPPSAPFLLAPGQFEGRFRSGSFVAPGEAETCFAAAIEARFTRRSCTRRTRPARYPARDPPQHGGARSTALTGYSQLERRFRSGSFVAPGKAQPCLAAAIQARFTRRSCTRRTRPSRYPERDPPQHGGARSTALTGYSQLEGRLQSTAFSHPERAPSNELAAVRRAVRRR